MDKYGTGDSMKKGFWLEVFANFEKEIGGTIREYDTIVAKWKHSIRPKVAAFSVVYDSVQRMDTSGSFNLMDILLRKSNNKLLLDEEALRETLEEARAGKEWEERIKQEQVHDELFRLKFGVKFDSE
ncbi:hypothetical protein Tco_0716589 [Tanacetum coccineum]